MPETSGNAGALSTLPADDNFLGRVAERFGVSRRTLLAGIALPIIALIATAITLVLAPPSEHSAIVLGALIAVGAGLATTCAGVYGGVLVPGLLLIGIDPRFAAAVALFLQPLVIPLAAGSHYKMGNFSRALARPLLIGGVVGGFAGAIVAAFLPTDLIARLVALLIVVVGLMVLVSHRLQRLGEPRAENDVPTGRVAGIGLTAGISSGISGAGWGPLGVTLLILSRIDAKQAIGSSLFVRTFMAIGAVAGYIVVQAATQTITPNWWIVVPLFVGSLAPMIPGAMVVSRLGRARATIAITLLSIILALPTLVFGH